MAIRIAMWSGPRNISTTMMRAFENRSDTAVIDEPFYAHYLSHTGIVHPMQDKILAAQSSDWREVVESLTQGAQSGVFFQKQMTHHITDEMTLDWLKGIRHFFLIRDPRQIVASYTDKMETVSADAIGLRRQVELFDEVTRMTGEKPPVVDASQILNNPKMVLTKLCKDLHIPFEYNMLTWPAGARDSDGVWAPHWYNAVSSSTGFREPVEKEMTLTDEELKVVDEVQPFYDYLFAQTGYVRPV